jgi:hypothetical protein
MKLGVTWVHPRFSGGVPVAHLFWFLCFGAILYAPSIDTGNIGDKTQNKDIQSKKTQHTTTTPILQEA